MNILEVTKEIKSKLYVYIDIISLEVGFKICKDQNINMHITVFYTENSNNFTTYFYHFRPFPSSINEIIDEILKSATSQRIQLKKPINLKTEKFCLDKIDII